MISEKNIGDSVIIEFRLSSRETKEIRGFIRKYNEKFIQGQIYKLYDVITVDQKQLFTFTSLEEIENKNYRVILFEKKRYI